MTFIKLNKNNMFQALKKRMTLLKILIQSFFKLLQKMFKLMVGQSDYESYLNHFLVKHPEKTPLSEKEFFQENLQRRYRKGSSRCC
jgi:uncharacterized short protein YbdD (DUF466 family)